MKPQYILVIGLVLIAGGCDTDTSKDTHEGEPVRDMPAVSSQPEREPTTMGKRFRLTEFRFNEDLTAEKLRSAVGPPSRIVGSGIAYYVYDLVSGEELWVSFVFGRDEKLDYAFVQPSGSQNPAERRTVYISEAIRKSATSQPESTPE